MKFHKKRTRRRDAVPGPKAAVGSFNKVLSKHGIAREIREHRILIDWAKIVGPRVAARTMPDALDKGVLWVRVDSSAWMHQLSFLKQELISKANQLCGEEMVKDVRFHLGRHKARSDGALGAAARIARPHKKQRPLPEPARGRQLQAIIDQTEGIEDEELRTAIVEIRRRLNM